LMVVMMMMMIQVHRQPSTHKPRQSWIILQCKFENVSIFGLSQTSQSVSMTRSWKVRLGETYGGQTKDAKNGDEG
jgi:hypothetical protein